MGKQQKTTHSAASANSCLTLPATSQGPEYRTKYEYDSLGQIKSGKKFWADGTPVAGQQFEYAHDDIGNRTGTKTGGDANGMNLRPAAYSADLMNRYSSTNSGPFWEQATISATGETPVIGNTFVPKSPEFFGHDADGNALQHPPTKGPYTGYGGLTWFNAFEPRARVYKSIDGPCCWKVIVPGYADLYYWWVVIVPGALQHEMLHVSAHRDTYKGFNGSASRFVGNCYSEPKAKCYHLLGSYNAKLTYVGSNGSQDTVLVEVYNRSGWVSGTRTEGIPFVGWLIRRFGSGAVSLFQNHERGAGPESLSSRGGNLDQYYIFTVKADHCAKCVLP